MTIIEALTYLTDSTFTSVVVIAVATFAALQAIHRIGGRQ